MSLFSINGKMKKSAKGKDLKIVNFTIPAFRTKSGFSTCPNAGVCAAGCYARMGAYLFSNVYAKHEKNLNATFQADFEILVNCELKKIKPTHVRIHDSGDFYNADYLMKWLRIATLNPTIKFYAYTKMVAMIKNAKAFIGKDWPANFEVIFSLGGKEDHLIDRSIDRHSRVFDSFEALTNAGYADASHDDMVAIGANPKIGLVYHGKKTFENTAWDKVSA